MKFFLFFVLFFISISKSFASEWEISETCSYKNQINECIKASKQWTVMSIEEYECIDASPALMLYQIILDKKFKEIDKKAEEYLALLEQNKSYYFWIESQKTIVDALDDIDIIFSDETNINIIEFNKTINTWFLAQYYDVCKNIWSQVSSCYGDMPILEAWKAFNPNPVETNPKCISLAKIKNQAYKELSYNILLENKVQIRKDNRKIFVQEQRKKYNDLFELIRINLWYLERIWKKWPLKTSECHQ